MLNKALGTSYNSIGWSTCSIKIHSFKDTMVETVALHKRNRKKKKKKKKR